MILLAIVSLVPVSYAYDGDMDIYHEYKEDLLLIKDTYASALNVAMGEGSMMNPTWAAIEFEVPELQYNTLTEIPGGYKVKGSHGAYKLEAEIKVSPKEDDLRYEVKFLKGCNAPGKEIAGEVFR